MNEQFYREMIKSAQVGYAYHRMVYDNTGSPVDYTFLDVNTAFEEMIGAAADEIIGRTVTELFPHFKKDPFNWIAFYGEVAEGGGAKEFEQFSEVLGRWYQVKVFSTEPKTFVTFALDITQRVATEEQMLEYNEKLQLANMELDKNLKQTQNVSQVKTDFLANMSHEMRTPLNAVIGMSQLALEESVDPAMGNYLKQIIKSGQDLLEMINDVLDYAKLEAGHLTIREQVLHLNKVVQEVTDNYASRARQKSIALKVTVDSKLPAFLVGDETRLKQVLMNLLSNAVKFTYHGGVELSVRQVSETGQRVDLEFQVKDTGVGIPMEQVDVLFKPFSQADSSITRPFQGSGLGLSISRQLVTLMGGKLWVVSQVGKGSVFTFQVPFELATDMLANIDMMEEALQANEEDLEKELGLTGDERRLETLIDALDTLEKQLVSHSFIDNDVVNQLGKYLCHDSTLRDTFKTLKEALAAFDYESSLIIVSRIKNQLREG